MDVKTKRRLIIKTAISCVICFVVAAIAFCVVFVLGWPLQAAGVLADMGMYSSACKCYKIAYERDDSINNLYLLADMCVLADDNDATIEYILLLQEHEDYSELIENVNELNGSSIGCENNRLTRRVILAMCENGDYSGAVEYYTAHMLICGDDYQQMTGYDYLVYYALEGIDGGEDSEVWQDMLAVEAYYSQLFE